MKKILLFVSACLFAFAASATTITLSPNSWTDDTETMYNYQGSASVLAGEWVSGDEIEVQIEGTVSGDVTGLSFSFVDQSSAAGWWKPLCESQQLGDFTAGSTISFSATVALNADVVTPSSVNMVFGTAGSTVEPSGSITIDLTTFSVQKPGETVLPNITLNENGEYNYLGLKSFADFGITENLKSGDVLVMNITGSVDQAIEGLKVSIIDQTSGWNDMANWGVMIVENPEKDAEFTKQIEITLSADLEDVSKCWFSFMTTEAPTEAYSSVKISYSNLTFAKKEDESSEQNKIVMNANETFNYQSAGIALGLSEAPAVGDTVELSLTNVTISNDVDAIQVFLVEQGADNSWNWNVVSNYAVAMESPKASDAAVAEVKVKVIIENAITYPGIVSAYVATTTAPVESVESVTLFYDEKGVTVIDGPEDEGGEGGETAVEDVNASSFAVEGGMVYSAGEIVVYNVAGAVVATANHEFNVFYLESGVYFITAPEGTIKFVK